MKIRIAHLYPELMNLYGDRGNILALSRRTQWHGLEAEVVPIHLNETFGPRDFDILFIGGGQDKEQKLVCEDFAQVKGACLQAAAEDDAVILAICGGYQLLGKSFRIDESTTLSGIGILDAWTEAGNKRLIGNAAIEVTFDDERKTLVGFENHSGQTFLGPSAAPLGKVIAGFGNNGTDGLEGCVYRNVFGTYLHGSLLPKNPWFADHLLALALKRRGESWAPRALDDRLEESAHQTALRIAREMGKNR